MDNTLILSVDEKAVTRYYLSKGGLMKKIINNVDAILDEMLDGFCYEHNDIVERIPNTQIVKSKLQKDNTVALISGGGSGHEPSHAGFVGQGMLSAAVCGEVFTSPTPDQILEAILNVKNDQGVLLVVKNYSGDIMNFEMAMELAIDEGISVEMVVVNDDIAVEDSTYTTGRRGVAGTVLVHKILGSYADQGATLAELKEIGDQLIPNIHTLGVALKAATVPAVGKPGFELAEDEIEFGVGIHGEPGYRREKIGSSKELSEEIINRLKYEFKWNKDEEFGVLVNGLGATPYMEQYIFMNDVHERLTKESLTINFRKSGNLMTALDMTGLSLTMIRFENEQWLKALNYPVNTAAWR